MYLHQLFREFNPHLNLEDVPDVQIHGICEDSRLVNRGDLFIARPGAQTNGVQFVAEAAQRGAAAVVTPMRIAQCPIPQVPLDDPASYASALANIFFDHPSRKIRLLGITGTNGKTTVTYLVRHLLAKMNLSCGLIGTVEVDDGRTKRPAVMTTPRAVDTARLLADMRDNGCAACVMEVSSHALDQSRVAGLHFAGAAFTNLTGDHLDYHGTMENYADAKAKLFGMLGLQAVAVVNADDAWSEVMLEKCRCRGISFGISRAADYQARDILATANGSRFILKTPDGQAEAQMSLIGRHNIANALTASALVGEVFGLSVHQIADALRDAPAAPGRLQVVRAGQPFTVVVDYAHTDDALRNVLLALRPLNRGKLRVVFGCGGDRDRTKRPRMALVASQLADAVYVTSDNPRTEDARSILDEICTGFPAGCKTPVTIEPDRRTAIERALRDSADGDVVLLAGKGHENYQIIGTNKFPFDDALEATTILQRAFAA